jgi:hypothetical protein
MTHLPITRKERERTIMVKAAALHCPKSRKERNYGKSSGSASPEKQEREELQ